MKETSRLGPWKSGVAPGRFPWFSHVFQMLRQPLEFMTSLRRSGDIVKIRLGSEWAYVIRHPELIRKVLITDFHTFDKGGPIVDQARTLIGNGLPACPNADHPRQRRLTQPLFSHDHLVRYATVMRDEASAMIDSWRSGQVVEIDTELLALVITIAIRTMFSTQSAVESIAEVQHALPVIMAGLYQRMLLPVELIHKLPTPTNRRFDRAMTWLRTIVDQITENYRSAGVDHNDLLSTLLTTRDSDTTAALTNGEIYDQVITFLVSGTETVSSTLSWVFHVLGQHPEIEARLHAEVDAALAGRPAGFDDLDKLDYTRRVITETLRLYPPVWMNTRRTTAEVELGGERIMAGTTILFSPYALQRDPDIFADPQRFDPDRWLPDRAKAVPRCAMIPFGAGKRRCIGEAFAMNESTIILSTLAGRWRLRPIAGAKIRHVPALALRPGSLPMRVESRRRAGEEQL